MAESAVAVMHHFGNRGAAANNWSACDMKVVHRHIIAVNGAGADFIAQPQPEVGGDLLQ